MNYRRLKSVSCLAYCGLFAGALVAQVNAQSLRPDREKLPQPVYKVSERLENPPDQVLPAAQAPAAAPQHPLAPALSIANTALAQMQQNVKDYSCTLIKRERFGKDLGEHEYMFVKIREQPFSVYTYFLGPEKKKGTEAIYVQGKYNNKIVGHGVGIEKMVGTVYLDPLGVLAMRGQRYPITDIGLTNLTTKLITIAEADSKFGECDVKFFKGAKINKRTCTCIQVEHPVRRKNFLFHRARVFYDDELNMITRYEAYDWPSQPGEEPPLSEEYTYLNLKLNNNFTDADFDPNNPSYGYR
jgi:hypothetical protein